MRRFPLCLFALLAVGCGAEYVGSEAREEVSEASADYAMAGIEPAPARFATAAPAGSATAAEAVADLAAPRPRIIYTATITVNVKDFEAAEVAFLRLVADHAGYVADSSARRSPGSTRSGRWTVRIPTGRYDTFLAGLDGLGYVADRRQTAADVTAEFIDTQARIANMKRLEERLVALLADRPGKLDDLLEIERELARVRGEIEQAEGRLRYLTNKTDFSTVTVSLVESREYVAPQPKPEPTFGERIAKTWGDSLTALRRTGEAAVLIAVAAAPWLVIAALPLLVMAFVILRVRRRIARRG